MRDFVTYRIKCVVVRWGQKWTRQATGQTRRRSEQLPRRAVRQVKQESRSKTAILRDTRTVKQEGRVEKMEG